MKVEEAGLKRIKQPALLTKIMKSDTLRSVLPVSALKVDVLEPSRLTCVEAKKGEKGQNEVLHHEEIFTYSSKGFKMAKIYMNQRLLLLRMITPFHLDIVECDPIFQVGHFGLQRQVPLDVVDEASPALTKLALVFEKSFTVIERLLEIATDVRKSLEIPFVVVGRK